MIIPLQPHQAMLAEQTAPGRVCAGALSKAPRRPPWVETSGARGEKDQPAEQTCLPSTGRGVIPCDGNSSVAPALLYKAGLTLAEVMVLDWEGVLRRAVRNKARPSRAMFRLAA